MLVGLVDLLVVLGPLLVLAAIGAIFSAVLVKL